jgi:hypothetical protein
VRPYKKRIFKCEEYVQSFWLIKVQGVYFLVITLLTGYLIVLESPPVLVVL